MARGGFASRSPWQREERREKKLSILFTLALMVGTLACGGEDEQQQPVQEPEPTESTQVEPRDGTVGDDVQG